MTANQYQFEAGIWEKYSIYRTPQWGPSKTSHLTILLTNIQLLFYKPLRRCHQWINGHPPTWNCQTTACLLQLVSSKVLNGQLTMDPSRLGKEPRYQFYMVAPIPNRRIMYSLSTMYPNDPRNKVHTEGNLPGSQAHSPLSTVSVGYMILHQDALPSAWMATKR